MKTETISFRNLETGELRFEIWNLVEYKNKSAYQAPNGRYYTKGLIGWFDITDVWS